MQGPAGADGSTLADASSTVKGKIQLAGDLTGTSALPIISISAITSAKILDNTIVTADIADNSIISSKIADGTISSSDLADNSVILTTKVNGFLPVANGGTNSNVTLNNNRIMISAGGAIKETAALTNGQLLIGSTGATPTGATLTAGNGITITNTAGAIIIASTPTIQQVTGTTTISTSSTTDVTLSTPISITPGAGDYLIFFTAVVSNNTMGIGAIMSIYVNGVKIPASEIQATSGKAGDKNTIASNAYFPGITAGQAIEIRWRAENNTASVTNRTLIVQRVK